LIAAVNSLQVGAHPRLVGDDSGILRVGLPLAPIGCGGVVDDPARDIEHLLAVIDEQRNQQRGATRVQVCRPDDLSASADFRDFRDELQQHGFVVLDSPGQQCLPILINYDAVMRPLPRVNSRPHCRHACHPFVAFSLEPCR